MKTPMSIRDKAFEQSYREYVRELCRGTVKGLGKDLDAFRDSVLTRHDNFPTARTVREIRKPGDSTDLKKVQLLAKYYLQGLTYDEFKKDNTINQVYLVLYQFND